MPSFVKDEEKWTKAKEIVEKEYKLTEKDGDKYWKLVVGVYKKMKGQIGSTRLKRKATDTREYIIPTAPLYNPLGTGEDDSEFKNTDSKSYQQWFNRNVTKQKEKEQKK